jgi:pyruvate,water dikinase
VATLADAGALRPGEVLVCPATSPEWTPYFGVAGALVTNSGGALSHAAIVAREFGIPAVVATVRATAVIPDGAMLTVDGNTGSVTIEP